MGKYDFKFDLYEDSTLAWIARRISMKSDILEFGAANGRLTKFLSEEKECNVDIVEIDEESGSEAAQYARKAFVGKEQGNIENLKWIDENTKYDFIVIADVLEHLPHPKDVLDKCQIVLKEQGRILVSVPNIAHNAVIIELLNDRFDYRPIGLLDSTHIHFFTRKTFLKMAESVGLAVVYEKAKHIRVGETEIQNSYKDVSKEIFKELVNRENGDVYQYMFELAPSAEYLKGNCARTVSLEGASYYYMSAYFDQDGQYDYKKSVTHHINPHQQNMHIEVGVLENSTKAQIVLLNCNCVLSKVTVSAVEVDGTTRSISYKHNAVTFDEFYFFAGQPQIDVEVSNLDKTIIIDFVVLKYDFEDNAFEQIYFKACGVRDDDATQLKLKDKELEDTIATYESMIQKKDEEFRESVATYENMMQKKDEEFKKSAATYENMIRKKDEEFQESVATYENMIRKKDEEFQNSVQIYENVLKKKEEEYQLQIKQLENQIHDYEMRCLHQGEE